jgi:catechol 2,3-dioxygenase-like lactoylglutathione lyase family enzyme
MQEIRRIDHYSIRTLDMDATRKFYTQVMGFNVGPRPPFKFPGFWLYNGEPPKDLESAGENYGMVHIIGIDPNDPAGLIEYLGDVSIEKLKETQGAFDHLAFRCVGRDAMIARCETVGWDYFERTVPSLGLHQVFLKDPSGVTIELNYPASEAPKPKATAAATA